MAFWSVTIPLGSSLAGIIYVVIPRDNLGAELGRSKVTTVPARDQESDHVVPPGDPLDGINRHAEVRADRGIHVLQDRRFVTAFGVQLEAIRHVYRLSLQAGNTRPAA